MRWIVGIVLAAGLGTLVVHFGGGSEVAYVVRAITRHLVGFR